jgi:hypothetical protein
MNEIPVVARVVDQFGTPVAAHQLNVAYAIKPGKAQLEWVWADDSPISGHISLVQEMVVVGE